MSFKDLKERNVGSQEYMTVDIEEYPQTPWDRFKQVVDRTFSVELFNGLRITFKIIYSLYISVPVPHF